MTDTGPLFVSSGDLIADRRYKWALDHAARGDLPGAVAAFEQARDADPEDYHGARLQLARLGAAEAAPAMTETYVRRLFDQYAERYDAALTERLGYRGPALLRQA